MTRRATLLTLTLLGVSALTGWTIWHPFSAQPSTAEQILECARRNWVEGTFHGTIRMELFRPEYSKQYRLEAWTSGSDRAFIHVLEPKEDAGSGYLRTGDELWYYHPDVGQAVSLPASALSENFFGADLALEDLYHGTLSKQYDVELLGSRPASPEESEVQGDRVHQLRLQPKPDAPSVYGKLEMQVRASDCAVLVLDYYDQRGTLIRQAKFSQFVRVGENGRVRSIPLQMTFDDLLKQGSRTIETVESYEFDIAIPEQRFTLDCLVKDICGSS